jgi:hypothetical protein
MSYINHTLSSLDTLPSIAEKYLGSASLWVQLASVNGLRAPFISDDAYDQLDPERARIAIPHDLPFGSTKISFNYDDIISGKIPRHVLAVGSVLFIRKYLLNGDTTHDTIKIKRFHHFRDISNSGDILPKGTVEFDTELVKNPVSDAITSGLVKRKVYFNGIWSENGSGPETTQYNAGDLLIDAIDVPWICTSGGSPGTWSTISYDAFGQISSSRFRTGRSAARYYVKYSWVGNNSTESVLCESVASPFASQYSSSLPFARIDNVVARFSEQGTLTDYIYDLYPQSMDGLDDASGLQTTLVSASPVEGIMTGKIGNGTARILKVNDTYATVVVTNTDSAALAQNPPVAGYIRSITYSPASYIPLSTLFSSNEFMVFKAPSVWPDGAKAVAVYIGTSSNSLKRLPTLLTSPSESIEEPESGFVFLNNTSPPTNATAYKGITHSYVAGTEISFHDNPEFSVSRVLKTGDIILVPNSKSTNAISQRSLYKEDPTDIWGKDIFLDKTGQISFYGGSGTDIKAVYGRYNVVQSLYNRLQTPYKALSTQPQFGNISAKSIGSKYSISIINDVQTGITQTILQDPRIFSVESINVAYDKDVAALFVTNLTIKLSETGTVIGVTPIQINI